MDRQNPRMTVQNLTADAEVFTSNVYLVTGEQTVLVDAGAMDGIVGAIREYTDRIDAVALTHQHSDHIEQLDAVLDAFDPELWAYGPHPRRSMELTDGMTVQLGDESYEVVYTPGHADDHIAFVGNDNVFSGDVVVYNDGAFENGSFGRTDLPGQSRDRLIESLERLLDRVPSTANMLCAGHGDVFSGDARTVINRALDRARRRNPKYPDN